MAILAQLQQADSKERRGATRRRLQLATEGATPSTSNVRVVIHDLSVSGLLLETFAQFSVGERIEVQLPQAGAAEALIVWNSGRYFGCRFAQPISTGAVSAALLLSPGDSPSGENSELMSIALNELRALASRVEHITDKLDEAIEERRDGDVADAAAHGPLAGEAPRSRARRPGAAAWIAAGAALVAIVACLALV